MEIKELKTIHNLVKNILEEHPQARNSDNILYYYVIKHIGAQKGINIDSMSLPNFLLNMKAYLKETTQCQINQSIVSCILQCKCNL